jgi:peptidoglycan hydrolase-like protein with peptidoglycan-binding domain
MEVSARLSTLVVSTLLLAASIPATAMPRPHRGPTSPNLIGKRSPKSAAKEKILTQRAIPAERTTQIQTALIKAGYMTGKPTGTWDPATEAALEKFQGDNGWQTKLTPDSRAIIKLGLGPKPDSVPVPKSEMAPETPVTATNETRSSAAIP